MTGSMLIVAVPWIAFGIALLMVCVRLRRSSRAFEPGPGPGPGRPATPGPGRPAPPDPASVPPDPASVRRARDKQEG